MLGRQPPHLSIAMIYCPLYHCYPFIEIFIQILVHVLECYSKLLPHQLAQHLLSLGHHVATQTNLIIKMYLFLDLQTSPYHLPCSKD